MNKKSKTSETKTENLFRSFYGTETFVEKSAIPKECGFKSKADSGFAGFPDFFLNDGNVAFVVEAKATDHQAACDEVRHYISTNDLTQDVVGIAVSGQSADAIRFTAFLAFAEGKSNSPIVLHDGDSFVEIKELRRLYRINKYGEVISDSGLMKVLVELNKEFHNSMHIKETERSLFFAGIMIALRDANFSKTFQHIESSPKTDGNGRKLLESHNINKAILDAIDGQISAKANNLSKEYNWRDRFSFIKNIDYPLADYKELIKKVQNRVFAPFQVDEKRDILARAYKIFLSRAGSIENKNIILTPDHIKRLMVALARLDVEDVVIDTCTGSGGFLMESMEEMVALANHDGRRIESIKSRQLIGLENDPTLFALACSNMFLHGDGRTNLIFRSSLLVPDDPDDVELEKYLRSLRPTKAIINPPYENNSSIRFTKQALDLLDPNGRLVIIMPTPTLNHNVGGLTEEILKMAKLDFVVKMPNNLFSEQKRTVNTSIFGFTKTPHSAKDEVLFYNLDDDGFVSVQHKGRVDKFGKWSAIYEKAVGCLVNGRDGGGNCERMPIFDNGKLRPYGVRRRNVRGNNLMRVGDLFNIVKGTLASGDAVEGDYTCVTAAKDFSTHNVYEHDCEAIVYAVAAGGSLGRAHYVSGKFIASNLCLVLTPRDPLNRPVDMEFYAHYLNAMRRQIVNDLADGTSKPTIGRDDFANYIIEYIPLKRQIEFVDSVCPRITSLRAELMQAEKEARERMSQFMH